MFTLKKRPGRDFQILNLSDPQLEGKDWKEDGAKRHILEGTVRTLTERVCPDLITISGDVAAPGDFDGYEYLANFLDGFGVPWSPVWGNHDNEKGPETIRQVAELCMRHPHCLYESGPEALGDGNYVIRIEEEGKAVSAVVLMDTHDRMPYVSPDGETSREWAKLIPEQIAWYREQILALNAEGCPSSILVVHIPINAYRAAFEEALVPGVDLSKISIEESARGVGWKPEYAAVSFGVLRERFSIYPEDEGAFDAIRELGSTKYVIAGHNHMNNAVTRRDGVTLAYGLKTGIGSYWAPGTNGGTVLTVSSDGAIRLRHEYVDLSPWSGEI